MSYIINVVIKENIQTNKYENLNLRRITMGWYGGGKVMENIATEFTHKVIIGYWNTVYDNIVLLATLPFHIFVPIKRSVSKIFKF